MGQDKHVYSIDWAGRKLTVEIGQLAKQANGAVLVRYGIQLYYVQQQLQKNRKIRLSSH